MDLGQQLIGAGRAVEAADGLLGQAGLAHDRLDALALRAQRLDLLIALAGADGQGGVFRPPGGGRGGGLLQVRSGLAACRLVRVRFGGGFFQAAVVPGHRLFGVPGEVVIQVPAVSDLDRVRGALPCAVGVGAGPVPADHLGSGVLAQPVCEGIRLAVAQQVHRLAGLRVDQDGSVVPAAAEREIIDPQGLHGPGLGVGQGHDQPQQAGPSCGQVQQGGQPLPGPPGQGQRDPGEHARQRPGCAGRTAKSGLRPARRR